MSLGHVNKILGSVVLEGEAELDFVIDAPLPLVWQRSFVSDNADVGWLGRGWTLPLSFRVDVEGEALVFVDAQGRRVRFPLLAVGDAFFSPYEHTTLARPERNVCELLSPDGLRLVFGLGPGEAAAQAGRDAEEARIAAEFRAAVERLAQTEGLDVDALVAGSIDRRPPQADTLVLIGLVDPNGHWLRLHYTPDGRPQVIETSDGQHVGLVFRDDIAGDQTRLVEVLELIGTPDAAGRFASSTRLVEYRYGSDGALSEVVDDRGEVVRSFAWRGGQLVAHAEPGGIAVEYDWDQLAPSGRVQVERTSLGAVTRYDYDLADRISRATDASGRVTEWHYDDDKHLTALVAPDGSRTQYLRDIHGNLLRVTDPLGRVTRHSHDARGNLVRVEQPDGAAWHLRYTPRHRQPIAIIDPLGHATEFELDARGNLVRTRGADGAVTRYTLDAAGRPVHIVDARGGETTQQFDAAGRLVERRDCVGTITRFEYDRRGNLLRVIDALGGVTHYQYQRINRRDRVVALTHPDGAVERFAYDRLGRITAHHDPQGHATRYHLDPAGRPIARENALGHRLQYRYDVHGRLAELVNENGAVYRFGWDAVDRLICEQGFDARRIDYRYNAAGELVESVDGVPHGAEWMAPKAGGVLRSHYQRDAMGRLLEKLAVRPATALDDADPNSNAKTAGTIGTRLTRARYAYSQTGLLVQARNANARIELAYTPTGRLASETTYRRDGDVTRLSHRYDGLGNRIETVLPDGRVLKPELYGAGHVSKLRLDGEQICEFERDALHRETVRTQGKLRSFFERDAAGRLIRQFVRPADPNAPTPEPKIARQYHYDRSGQLLQIDDARSGRSLYRYDATGRLLAAQGPLGTERFAFDPASNLVDPNQPQAAQAGVAPASRKWTEAEWAEYVREHIGDPNFNPLLTPEQIASDPSQWGEARPNRLLTYQEHRYRYDTWGNTIEKRSGPHRRMRLHWDAEHQLRVIAIGEAEQETRYWAYDYDPFGRRIAKYPIDENAARAWVERGDEAALANAERNAERAAENARAAAADSTAAKPRHSPSAATQPSHAGNVTSLASRRRTKPDAISAVPTRFSWDGNLLLCERRVGTQKVYLYEPDSFVPLAIVRSTVDASENTDDAREAHRDRTDALSPELQTLKEQYPKQWARIQMQRGKLTRQLGQPAENEAQRPKAEVFHVHVDHLGTPREVTDADGQLVWAATYAAWGHAIVSNPQEQRAVRSGSALMESWGAQEWSLECNLRFQGQYADSETGLHYNRARYLDPAVGRFMSQDPIGLLGGSNDYAYAKNPTGYIDPYGLRSRSGKNCKECDSPCSGTKNPSRGAGRFQGSEDYPGHDFWQNAVLRKGTQVYTLAPYGSRPGGFFADAGTLAASGGSSVRYHDLTQVGHSGVNPQMRPPRMQVQSFTVMDDICVGKSRALANPQFGSGGGTQFYIARADRIKLAPGPMIPLN
jgi:RHS repeat-associated protein